MKLYNDNIKTKIVCTLDFDLHYIFNHGLEKQITGSIYKNILTNLHDELQDMSHDLEDLHSQYIIQL